VKKIMTELYQIGKEARELDEKKVVERMKLEKKALIKIACALIFYFVMMGILVFIL
jgi:hypothetical protein